MVDLSALAQADILDVYSGSDVICGLGGEDTGTDELGGVHLAGGPGNDNLEDQSRGNGPSWLFGGPGNDLLMIDEAPAATSGSPR